MLSIGTGLELKLSPYPHFQVKDRYEVTTVTRGSTLQLLMAGRKLYDISFKLKAMAATKTKSKEAIVHEFKVDVKLVCEWCTQKDCLVDLKKSSKSRRKRLKGAGKKALDENLEEELFDWVVDLRSHSMRVSRRMIREKAKMIMANQDSLYDFKASKGWLQLFFRRKNFSLRRKTTECQKTPQNVILKLVSYILHV